MHGWGRGEESALETPASTNFNCCDNSQAGNTSQQSGNCYQDFLTHYKGLAGARVSLYLKETVKEDFVFFDYLQRQKLCDYNLYKCILLFFFFFSQSIKV